MSLRSYILAFLLSALPFFGNADPIEGKWQVYRSGGCFEIVARAGVDNHFDVKWIEGDNFVIKEGEIIAEIIATPTLGLYDCRSTTDLRGKGRKSNRQYYFIIKLNPADANTITFEAYDKNMKFSLTRWLSRFFHIPLEKGDKTDRLDGAFRIDAPPSFIVI